MVQKYKKSMKNHRTRFFFILPDFIDFSQNSIEFCEKSAVLTKEED